MPTLFSDWQAIGRILVVGALGYIALLIMLRVSGKRTIAKMNVFDFVFTVALGSVLANVIISPTSSVTDGIAAFAVLILLQFIFSLLQRWSKRLEQIINGRPTLLVHRGRVLEDQLKRQRVTVEEVRAAVRVAGVPRLEEVDAVVLETDGVFSILREVPKTDKERTSLSDVEGIPEEAGAAG
jgi:uncharacterized membrane protein YcaP (DUF421 family)